MVIRFLLLFSILITSVFADENDIIIKRINGDFLPTWNLLEKTIKSYGYKKAYLQRCDFALNERHYKSDKYRIFVYGQLESMKKIAEKYPKMTAFLPLKITVMQEANVSLIIASQPIALLQMVNGKKDKDILRLWDSDLKEIINKVGEKGI